MDPKPASVVEAKDQVKGYETGRGDSITFDLDEIAEAIPDSAFDGP